MPDASSLPLDPRSALAVRLTGPGGPFELAVEDHGRGAAPSFRTGPQTLADVYARARAFRDKAFIVSDGNSLTYAQLFARADRLAEALMAAGLTPGDRVALAVADKADWIVGFVAITALGGTAVLLDVGQGQALGEAIARTGCKLGVTDTDEMAATVAAATGRPAVTRPSDEGGGAPPTAAITPADIALIAFTSGSSGAPKGVLIDHRGLLTGLRGMLLGGALQSIGAPRPTSAPPPPCTLVTAPLFHIGGYAQVLLAMMMGGKAAFAPNRASPADLVSAIAKHGATALGGMTPTLMRALLDARPGGVDLASLRTINVQGAHLPEDLLDRLKRDLPEVRVGGGYGMTETNGSITVSSEADLLAGGGRGVPLPTVEVRVVDAQGADLAVGEPGDVVVRGAILARGYVDADGATRSLDVLATGDVGILDADGGLRILDRRENCRWIGERLVSCREIETLALHHDKAHAASAAFAPEGQGVEVWVVADPTDEALRAELTATLTQGLPAEVGQIRLTLVRELPLTASGKVRRPAFAG